MRFILSILIVVAIVVFIVESQLFEDFTKKFKRKSKTNKNKKKEVMHDE